jgi:hypothetical protein
LAKEGESVEKGRKSKDFPPFWGPGKFLKKFLKKFQKPLDKSQKM